MITVACTVLLGTGPGTVQLVAPGTRNYYELLTTVPGKSTNSSTYCYSTSLLSIVVATIPREHTIAPANNHIAELESCNGLSARI